jgi:cytochrome c-type biogenesis protein
MLEMVGADALQRPDAFLVWLLGLSMGLTACTVTCLPFMGTWILGRGAGTRAALWDTGLFVLGRLCAYSALGALAGALGQWLVQALKGPAGNAVLGVASIGAGWWLLWRGAERQRCAVAHHAQTASVATVRFGAPRRASVPPFLFGVSLSLTPCAPLASLLAVCALANSAAGGAGYGLAFGLGAALTPLVFLLPLLALFGESLRDGRAWLTAWIRYGAAAVLILLGLRRLLPVLL